MTIWDATTDVLFLLPEVRERLAKSGYKRYEIGSKIIERFKFNHPICIKHEPKSHLTTCTGCYHTPARSKRTRKPKSVRPSLNSRLWTEYLEAYRNEPNNPDQFPAKAKVAISYKSRGRVYEAVHGEVHFGDPENYLLPEYYEFSEGDALYVPWHRVIKWSYLTFDKYKHGKINSSS